MNNLCEFESFRESLEKSVDLLSEENLQKRGISEISENIIKLRCFLKKILLLVENKNIYTYDDLINYLNSSIEFKDYMEFFGFLGKMLDAVQLLKPSARQRYALLKLKENLQRTGHAFLIEEIPKEYLSSFYTELIEASATFILLEIISVVYHSSKNPLSTLRRSMGDRLPEEYFSELISGWIIEDIFIHTLQQKGIEAKQEGVDKERNIKFIRQSKMGNYDIVITTDTNLTFSLEVQRVGQFTKTKEGKYKTALKRHKYELGDSKRKIILLWVGKNPVKLAKRDYIMQNKMFFIANIKNNKSFEHKDDYLFVNDIKALLKQGISWEGFKELSKADFESFLSSL